MHLHKSWICILSACILLSLQSSAQDAEENAIKKAIADQDAAFTNRNVEAWKASWLQDDKTIRNFNGMFVSNLRVGWKNTSEGIIKFLKENPGKDSAIITTDSFIVRREGNVAIVNYKQEAQYPHPQPPFIKQVTREQKVLIKKNGKWLVASSTSTEITNLGIDGTELSLNAIGYNYLFADKVNEAIKVLEVNASLFPDSFNVWDSLGEAYAKAGNKEKAIECYQKSLVINPGSESGKKAISELK